MSNKIKNFINEYCEKIDKCDLESIKNVLNIHYLMNNKILDNSDLEINKINKYLEDNKETNDNNIIKLIKFIELKNKYIIKETIKLKNWEQIINNIIKNNNLEKINNELIEKILIKKLLEKVREFNGNWDIIELNSKGLPKSIILVNPEYEKYILENI